MDNINSILKKHYQIIPTNLSSQQGGWASLAYQICNGNQSYFLKVYEKSRASTPKLTENIDQYVPVIQWLSHHSEIKDKISVPLLTVHGDYKCEDEYGIYLLYEYIDGETIGNQELTDDQVVQLSQIIANLHLFGEELPVDTSAIIEDFQVPFSNLFRETLTIENKNIASDVQKVVRPYIRQLNDLVHTLEKLSIYLKNSDLRLSLCHTDLHYFNLMQSKQQLILNDWEGLKLAPVEADLMFLVDKPYYGKFLNMYQQTHPNFKLNPNVLRFYKGRRKLEDIGEFLEQLLYDDGNEQERDMTMTYLEEELKTMDV